MKKITLLSLFIAAGLLLVQCTENDEPEIAKPDTEEYEIYSEAVSAINSITHQTTDAYADTTSTNGRKAACYDFSFNLIWDGEYVPGFGNNYGKISMNFDGASCNDGNVRDGSITMYFKGWGAERKDSVIVDNYQINGYTINGTRTSHNLPEKSSFTAPTDKVITDVTITFPDETTYTYKANEEFTLNSVFSPDGTISWRGEAQLVLPNGYTIYGNIANPLTLKNSCSPSYKYVVAGSLVLTNNVDDGSLTINYGDGTCDQTHEVTLSNGEVITETND